MTSSKDEIGEPDFQYFISDDEDWKKSKVNGSAVVVLSSGESDTDIKGSCSDAKIKATAVVILDSDESDTDMKFLHNKVKLEGPAVVILDSDESDKDIKGSHNESEVKVPKMEDVKEFIKKDQIEPNPPEKRIMYFGDLPYLETKINPTKSEILNSIHSDNETVIGEVPIRCQKNAIFIVNTSKLDDPNDILADDNGCYKNNGCTYNLLTAYDETLNDDDEIHLTALPRSKHQLDRKLQSNQYLVRTTFYRNASCKDFTRKIYDVRHKDGLFSNRLLQYKFEGPERDFDVTHHQNSKKNFNPHARKAELSQRKRRLPLLSVEQQQVHLYYMTVSLRKLGDS
ncbi:uncharacterized protein [Clytia hemisphaerica]